MTGALAERSGAAAKPDGPGTEVAERPKDTLDHMIDYLTDKVSKQLPAQIPGDYFLRTALTGLRRNRQLAQLAVSGPRGRASIYAALLEAARFGLMPFTDEGAIVVFGQGNKAEATFIPMYKGLIAMMYRTGMVSGVEARLIHQRDDWGLSYGDGGGFRHEPLLIDPKTGEPADRGKPILAYCFIRLKDGERTSVVTLTRAEAEDIRDRFSRSYANAEKSWDGKPPKRDSAWHTDFEKQWIKSAIRRADAPKSPVLVELLTAAARDDTQRPPAAEAPKATDFGLAEEDEIADAFVVDDPSDPGPADPDMPAWTREYALGHLHSAMRDYGFGGDDEPARSGRHAIESMLARADVADKPVPVASSADLTDNQLRAVCDKLDAIGRTPDREPRLPADVHADLAKLAAAAGWKPEPAADAK